MFCVLCSQACDRVNLRPATLAISTGSVDRPVGRAARQPKQRVDGMTGGTPGRCGAMAHGLAVSLLAGIRREVVWVGVAACLKCRGGMRGFIQIEKVYHISSRGRDDFPMRFGKCKGGRLSRKQFLKAHLILIQSAEPLLGYTPFSGQFWKQCT